jgi:hypothetical protein
LDRGAQVPSERPVDGGDPVDRRVDRFGRGDPGAFVGGAGGSCSSTEAGGGGELVDECVAFGVQCVASTDVGPFFGLGEVVFEVV